MSETMADTPRRECPLERVIDRVIVPALVERWLAQALPARAVDRRPPTEKPVASSDGKDIP